MKRAGERGGVGGLARYGLIGGPPFGFRKDRLHRRANGTVAKDPAEGTDLTNFGGGMQIGAALMRDLADYSVFVVVVKDFSRV